MSTSNRPPGEASMLYHAVAVLTRRWCRVLLVFFRMDEIVTPSHRVSVLRDSRHVETVATDRTGECELVRRMQGRAQGEVYPGEDPAQGAVMLSARGLTGGVVVGLDLKLRSSEILGVTGLVGMGMTSRRTCCMASCRMRGGSLRFNRQSVALLRPEEMRRRGRVCARRQGRRLRSDVGDSHGELEPSRTGRTLVPGPARSRHRAPAGSRPGQGISRASAASRSPAAFPERLRLRRKFCWLSGC